MVRIFLIFVAIAGCIYLAFCLALFLGQRSFIYYPQPQSVADLSPPLILSVADARLVISIGTPAGSPARAIIYFGGNAEDVRYSLPILTNAFPDRAVFAMNYRGYGGSSGKPSEAALIADAQTLFDRVHSDHDKIIVIGRSLGSGVAVQLASERSVERLVLITPYDSIQNLAAAQFPYFPVRWLLSDKYESWRYAQRITAPTQLIAAQNDQIIPAASTTALYKHFPANVASLVTIPNVGHNNISESPEYIPLLNNSR